MKRNQPNQLAGAYGTGATRAEVSRFNLLFGDKSDEPEQAGKTKNKLPSAICSYILTFLDIQSLIRGRLVSKLFSKHASKPCSLKHCKFDFVFKTRHELRSLLERYPQITSITLSSLWGDADIRDLTSCADLLKSLEVLCLEGCPLSSKSFQLLSGLSSVRSLTVLGPNCLENEIKGPDLRVLAKMKRLHTLCVPSINQVSILFKPPLEGDLATPAAHTQIIEDDLGGSFHNHHLLSISLSSTDIDDHGLSMIFPSPLIQLDLSDCLRVTGELFSSFPVLKELNLRGVTLLTDAGVEKIVSGCPNIEDLKLGWSKHVTSVAIEHISRLTRLTSLGLRGLKALREIPDALAPLIKLVKTLTRLDIARNHSFDVSVTKLKNLKELDASWSSIDENGLRQLTSLTSLRVLRLRGCKHLSACALGLLRTSFSSSLLEIELDPAAERQLWNAKTRKGASKSSPSDESENAQELYVFYQLQQSLFSPASSSASSSASHAPLATTSWFPSLPSTLTPCELMPKSMSQAGRQLE